MPIKSHLDETKKLTIFKATGVFQYDEIISAVKSFYEDEPTENVLWDLTDITGVQLTSGQIETIANFSLRSDGTRPEGKTAMVAAEDETFGLSRMFGTLSEIKTVPIEVNIFRSMEEAYQWLSEEYS